MQPVSIRDIPPFDLSTTDGNGNRHQFKVITDAETGATFRLVDQSRTYILCDFDVHTIPPHPDHEHFQLTLIQYDDGLLRIHALENYKQDDFSRKGITPALIDWIARHFNHSVESSSNLKSERRLTTERRSEEAEVVWRKIVDRGQSTYDQARDVFVYPVPS